MNYEKEIKHIEYLLEEASHIIQGDASNHKDKKLPPDVSHDLDIIISVCESRKAILTVLLTLLVYKYFNPNQDIRNHQANLPNGFSGRTFDTQFITPFMKKHGFPSMIESGWLTRSFEQNSPYDLHYRGKITPPKAKTAFLSTIDSIQSNKVPPKTCLIYIFQKLIEHKESHRVNIINPLKKKNISIDSIIYLLEKHFFLCSKVGKARLPVLALYSIYQVMLGELNRYSGKYLKPLESHTSADFRSGGIGDIEVLDENHVPFEVLEIKYEKPITVQMIRDAYEKFKPYPVIRYYLLSTQKTNPNEFNPMKEVIKNISKEHGCHIIVNGVIDTLKYYLRLINNTHLFLDVYILHVLEDSVIKKEHKNILNELLANLDPSNV